MQDTSSHEHPTDRLSEYADDELSAAERTTVERHLSSCAECRQVLAELRAVSARARGLIDTPPAADLWPGVAAAVARQPRGRARPARRVSFTLPQLVAAGLALMLLSGGMVWMARLGGERTDFPAVEAEPRYTPMTAAFAGAPYDDAIDDLQQTLNRERERLDPHTVQVLEQNLAAIDRAIEQCRRALADDPANPYLGDHLVAAKKRKLAILRQAAALATGAS